MKKMLRYGLVVLAIAFAAVLAISPVTTLGDYPPKVQEALNQTMMIELFGDLLASQNISIGFGDIGRHIADVTKGSYNLTINNSYAGANVSVIKALLAHELTHIKWAANGTGALVTGNLTFAEEYDCFKTEAGVWREHKGGLTDGELDAGENVIFTNGEYRNKDEVKTTLEGAGYTFSG
jgi:hypothetical protein